MSARDRILVAFRELVLSEPFDDLTAHDVIHRAGVARSTFYAHFHGKDHLLLCSLEPILTVLGGACRGMVDQRVLVSTLEHVWENRAVGRVMFRVPVSARLATELVRMLERERMDVLRCHFVVNGLLGLLGAWVMGRLAVTATELGALVLALARSVAEVAEP